MDCNSFSSEKIRKYQIFFNETSFVNLFFFFLTEVMLSLPKHVDVHPMAVKKNYVLFRLNLAML